MRFSLSAEAGQYIHQKGGAATVFLENRTTAFNWCGPRDIPCPSVRLGKPTAENMNNYHPSAYGDIQLFVQNEVNAATSADQPRIELERTLFGRKLVVYGFVLEATRSWHYEYSFQTPPLKLSHRFNGGVLWFAAPSGQQTDSQFYRCTDPSIDQTRSLSPCPEEHQNYSCLLSNTRNRRDTVFTIHWE